MHSLSSWTKRKLSAEELTLLNCGVGEDSWEFLGLQGDPTSPSSRRSVLGVHWKDWCWSWNFNTLATSCKELTHWKRPWCWERLRAGGEGDDSGWDGWMASLTRWTWIWVNSGSWWWTGRPGVLWFMGSQAIGHDWVTELNWTEPGTSLGILSKKFGLFSPRASLKKSVIQFSLVLTCLYSFSCQCLPQISPCLFEIHIIC